MLHLNGSLYKPTKKLGDGESKAFSGLRIGIILTGELKRLMFNDGTRFRNDSTVVDGNSNDFSTRKMRYSNQYSVFS